MKLTAAQLDAYEKMDEEVGKTARTLGVRLSTLDGLVEKGLATKEKLTLADSFPREAILYKKVPL